MTLLGFEIGAQEQVMCDPRKARNAAVAGVERALDGRECERPALSDFKGEDARLVLKTSRPARPC